MKRIKGYIQFETMRLRFDGFTNDIVESENGYLVQGVLIPKEDILLVEDSNAVTENLLLRELCKGRCNNQTPSKPLPTSFELNFHTLQKENTELLHKQYKKARRYKRVISGSVLADYEAGIRDLEDHVRVAVLSNSPFSKASCVNRLNKLFEIASNEISNAPTEKQLVKKFLRGLVSHKSK